MDNNAVVKELDKSYKENFKKTNDKKTLEIRDLNNGFLSGGTIKYEKGLVSIDGKGQLSFKGRISGLVSAVNEKELVVGIKNKPFVKAKLLKKTEGVECKRIINKPCKFLIASRDGIKLDTQEINMGDIVMLEPYIRLYDNYKIFVSEISDIKKPDLKSAVQAFKNGERGEGVITPRTQPWYSEEGEFIPNEALGLATPKIKTNNNITPITNQIPPKRQTNVKIEEDPFAKSWTKEADEQQALDTAPYKITKKVIEYTANGGVKAYGYELQDNNTGEILQKSEAEVYKLASSRKISNAFVRNDTLTGRGCSLANLQQVLKQ